MSDRRILSSAARLTGRNIASRRKKLGLNQDELADILGITPAALSRIENGVTAPRFSRLDQIAEALQCHVSDLFRTPGEPLEASLLVLEELLRQFPPESQTRLVAILEEVLRSLRRILPPRK